MTQFNDPSENQITILGNPGDEYRLTRTPDGTLVTEYAHIPDPPNPEEEILWEPMTVEKMLEAWREYEEPRVDWLKRGHWIRLIRESGKGCHPAWGIYEGLVEVPDDATLDWCGERYGTEAPSMIEKVVDRLLGGKDPYRGRKGFPESRDSKTIRESFLEKVTKSLGRLFDDRKD